MKSITRLELAMLAFGLIVCGTGYGIWRIQALEDNLTPSASVQKVEKKQLAEKSTSKQKGFDVNGRINVTVEK